MSKNNVSVYSEIPGKERQIFRAKNFFKNYYYFEYTDFKAMIIKKLKLKKM